MAKTKTSKTVRNSSSKKQEVVSNLALQMLANTSSIYRKRILDLLSSNGRNIDAECGYPTSLTIDNYKVFYERLGPAKRIVTIFPEESWSVSPIIYETEKSDETEFEKRWNMLVKKRRCLHFLQRIDILSGIGRYGVLLLGINDGLELDKPVNGINLKTGEGTGSNKYELLYLRPFSESSLTIQEVETDNSSPRYGQPIMYSIRMQNISKGSLGDTEKTINVHWTRVIHVADNREDSEVYGVPRMRDVFNQLLDIKKVLGSSAEMFWQGAFPGLSLEVTPNALGAVIDKESLRKEIKNYMDGLQRYLAVENLSAKSLAPQVADPTSHVMIQLKTIAISKGIPYRILFGSEEAKLASEKDSDAWDKRITRRQNEYVTPFIIYPFIERLMAFGTLPQIEEVFVDWEDLSTPSDKDKAEVLKAQMEAFSKYLAGNVNTIISPEQLFSMFMGLGPDEVKTLIQTAAEYVDDHEDEIASKEEEEKEDKEKKEEEDKKEEDKE